jgi:hypothetical protein
MAGLQFSKHSKVPKKTKSVFYQRYRAKLQSATISGKLRVRTGNFLSQQQGAFSIKGERKKMGKARFRLDHRGFMRQARAVRRITYKGPYYGKGRGYIYHPSGYHLSAQTRMKMSIARLNKAHPHAGGYTQTQATKDKISASLKKYNATHPAEVAARIKKTAATNKARR